MNLIEPTPSPVEPAAELIAKELLAGLNAALHRRVEEHAEGFHRFWDSPETPDAIAAAMGENGKLFLESSRENLRGLGTLAAMVGKTLNDAISPEHYMPRRNLTLDGNRLVIDPPREGHDAWGRPIPVEPEPERVVEPEQAQ
jgi:hypothetical protein